MPLHAKQSLLKYTSTNASSSFLKAARSHFLPFLPPKTQANSPRPVQSPPAHLQHDDAPPSPHHTPTAAILLLNLS